MRGVLRVLASLALAGAVVVAVFLSSATIVEAEPVSATGWWYKLKQGPAAGLGLPPPANVPDDGIYVANDPTGPLAVAALRYDGAAGAGATLTLQVAEGSNAAAAQLNICPAGTTWEPVANGTWDDRPDADCGSMAITGVPSADGLAVTWLVPASFAPEGATALDIVVTPVSGSPPTSVAFAPPGDDALVLTSPPSGGADEPGDGSAFPTVDTTPMPTGSFDVPAYDGGSVGLDLPPPTVDTPVEVGAAPTAPADQRPAALPTVPAAADDTTAARVASVITLLVIAGGLWWLSSQPARTPRLLGSLGGGTEVAVPPVPVPTTDRPRGIGRFARPRTAPPTRI